MSCKARRHASRRSCKCLDAGAWPGSFRVAVTGTPVFRTGEGAAFTQYAFVIGAPFGKLGVCLNEEAVTGIDFLPADAPLIPPASPLAFQAAHQLARYFKDPGWHFDLPLSLDGTPFQQRVWALLRTIPPGTIRRYGEIAHALDTGARAVGGACRANPVPIIVPCHRVVGCHGLVGYSGVTQGEGLAIKRWLLEHERRV